MSIRGALLVAVAVVALGVEPAQTQETGSMQVGNATVTVGGGVALLTLPEIEFVKIRSGTSGPVIGRVKSSDDFGDEIGRNIDGAITVPAVGMNGRRKWLFLKGFWAEIDDDDLVQCTSPAGGGTPKCAVNSIVDDPALADNLAFGFPATTNITTNREVDHWGVSLESKWQLNSDIMDVTRAPQRRYFALGADIRGIDQDVNLVGHTIGVALPSATLNEDLDTRYYGAYAAWGGDFPRFLFKGLWERWGLQSSFNLRGGIYYADTEYDGVSHLNPAFNAPRQLSLSESDVAFIGGLVLETRKQIGARAALSLKSEYEYYSWVPDMRYNDDDAGIMTGPNVGTSIGDEDAFSARTSLRLVVGLGPRELYQDPSYK